MRPLLSWVHIDIEAVRRRIKACFAVACIGAAVFCAMRAADAAAETATAAPPTLRIAVAQGARPIFDALLRDAVESLPPDTAREVVPVSAQDALAQFCRNEPGVSPRIVLSTQRMRPSMAATCAENGVSEIAALELGRHALILAVRAGSLLTKLSSKQVFLALARDVPFRDEFRRNVSVRWVDVDPGLPPQDIRFQLPARDDGSRLTFEGVLLANGCRTEKLVMQISNAQQRTMRCMSVRTDRVREIARELAVRSLVEAPEGTVGILSLADIESSGGRLVGLELDGVAPTRAAILEATYDHAASLWMYAKRPAAHDQAAHDPAGAAVDNAVEAIITRVQSEEMIGPDGVLARAGLSPMPASERAAQRAALVPMPTALSLAWTRDWAVSIMSGAWQLLTGAFQRNHGSDVPGAADFATLMDLAGYKLKEFESSVGIVPAAGMTFGIVREMSEADRDALDRALQHDSWVRTDTLSVIQRRIVRAVIEVGETEGYQVSKVQLTFLPLPEVRLIVSAAGAE